MFLHLAGFQLGAHFSCHKLGAGVQGVTGI
jgi:hypothetical protein